MELVSSIITSQPLRSPFHFRHHHTVTAITRRQLIAAAAVATAVSLSHKALAAEESLHQLSHGFLLDTAQTIPSAEDGHFNYSFNGKEGWITGKLAFLLYTEDKWQLIPLSAQLPVDMSGGSSRSSNKVERPRFFDSNTKRICWEKAKQVPGRDPERWRIDALGNIVCKRLHTCSGCLCYEYDHIIPFSKNGESVAENCQILQTRVNRLKSDKNGLDQRLLKGYSCDIKFSDEELDVIEMAVYGSVVRPEKRCVVGSISALHGKYSSRENTTPCNILGKTD